MANGDNSLREFIRLIPSVRALKESLSENVHMERYNGAGDPAVKLYQGLHAAISRLTDDPYLSALALDLPSEASDEEKVTFVQMAAGKLLAFMEGQTGLVQLGSGRGTNFAPRWVFNGPVGNLASEALLEKLSNNEAAKERAEERPEE